MIAAKPLAPVLLALGLTTLAWSASAQPRPPAAPPPAVPALPPAAAPAPPAAQPPADLEDERGPVRPARPDAADDEAPRPKAAPRPEDRPPVGPSYVMPAVDSPTEEPAPKPAKAPAKPYDQHWSAGMGFLGSSVDSPGFDPYSKTNTLPMISLFGTVTPWATRPVSVHLAFEYNYGGASATARGDASSLDAHRLSLGVEGRYQPISRMRLFVRAMPSVIRVDGSIQDPYLNSHLAAGSWTWGADLTAGAAARIGAVGHADLPRVSFWLGLDMGYRFAGVTSMRFRPADLTEDDQTRHFGEVTLPNLDLSGFVGKLSLSVGF